MRLFRLVVIALPCIAWSASLPCGARPPLLEAIDRALAAGAAPRTTSVLVTRGGSIVYEKYAGDGGIEHLNDTRSVGKSVTALLVGIAIGDGLLELDTRAFEVLKDQRPWANDSAAKDAITIEDLLTMSSALDCDDNDDGSPGNEEKMYPERVWLRWAVDLPAKKGYVRDGRGRGPWSYCTAGTFLLGQVLRRATGQSVESFARVRLFEPLGIAALKWHQSPSGEAMTGGGLRLSARDLARLGRLVLDNGRWEGKQIVPREYLTRAVDKHHATPMELDYGYLFWRRDYKSACGSSTAAFMAGNGGNHVVVVKDLDAVVVVTRVHYNSRGMHQQTMKLVEESILPALPCARPGPAGGEPRQRIAEAVAPG